MTAYSTRQRDRLWSLLPAWLREQDAPDRVGADAPPGALQALLAVIEAQADAVDADITQLANDAFVETCEPWVIPYIGDLVGTTPLFDESRVKGGDSAAEIFSDLQGPSLRPLIGLGNRADVAKTIYYRRRKGTLPMLEELARDVTGWPAHAVEFFQRLQWNQWLRNHVRPQAVQAPDLRRVEPLDRLGGAFDAAGRTVDVRAIAADEGWHGIKKLGFFLWRLKAHRLERVDARRVSGSGDFRWRFSPLGQDAAIFSAQRREDDETGLTERKHVPQAISHGLIFADLKAALGVVPVPDFSEFYGLFDPFPGLVLAEGRAMMVFIGGVPVPLARIRCRNLATWGQPAGDMVGIDVETGRIALGPVAAAAAAVGGVTVWYHGGFPGDLGGGPYRRRAWLLAPPVGTVILPVDASGDPGTFGSIAAALVEWVVRGRPDCIVRVRDNRTYADAIAIEPFDGRFIAIEAADGARPHLRLPRPLVISGNHDTAGVTLGGLLIEGRIDITGSLGALRLIHTTLVPGVTIAVPDPVGPLPAVLPAVVAAMVKADGSLANGELRVEAAFSVLGPMRLPDHARRLVLLDCVVDGVGTPALAGVAAGDFGPAARIERSTLRGAVRLRQIDLGSDSIFDGPVTVLRRQIGCLRFSWVSEASVTPRRYRCQPDLAVRRAIAAAGVLTAAQLAVLRAQIALRVQPEYVSEAYGQPAYLQLSGLVADEIATGSEDGAELGVWCHLKQPQRIANLKLRVEEYLPFGLSAAVIPVN